MNAPATRLFALAGALACGVLIAEAVRPPAPVATGVAAAALALACARRRLVVLLVAAMAVGLCLAGLRLASLEDAALARGAAHNADALLEGEALSDAETSNGAQRFLLGARHAEIDGVALRVRERAWVTVRPPLARIEAGAIVRVDARLRPVLFRGMDAAGIAAARRLVYRGVAARAFANPDGVRVIGRTRNPVARVASAGRRAVRRAASHLPREHRGLLLGVTIGDTSLLDPDVELDFRATGLSHIVAVSGANVAMVLAMVAFLLRLARAGRRVTIAMMASSLIAFMAVARFEPSILRAGAMTGIALTGLAIGARREAITTLAAASCGLLAIDPFIVHAPGFQLSALATLGLLVLTPRIAARLPEGKLAAATAVTLGAQVAVAPLIVLHFHQLSIIAVAANLLVAPMVAPATIAGMASAVAGALWSPLGVTAAIAGPPIWWMQWIAHVLAQLPLAAIATPRGVLGFVVAVVLTWVAIRVARRRTPMVRRVFPALLCVALVATAGVWARALEPPPLGGLVVTMLDVGQGDAFVVRAQGRTMMIDGGADERTTLRLLRAQGVRRVDLLVSTHPHADHVDGLAAVAARYPVARALDPYIDAELPSYHAFVRALAQRRIPRDRAIAGTVYRLGSAMVDVLWPPAEHMSGTPADVNNNSVVLRVRYGADAVLFAGEIQEEAQQALLDARAPLTASVLKVSHHGSRHMLPAFYAETGARIALIPVGPNTFGHPAAETLAAVRAMRVVRTDRSGTVSVTLDGRGHCDVREERHVAAA